MTRPSAERTALPVFHEPVFNEGQQETVPPYFSVAHPSDNAIYAQIRDLLTKDVVAFPQSRAADGDLYPLATAFGDYGPAVIAAVQSAGQIVIDILGDSGASQANYYPDELSVAASVTQYINSAQGNDRPTFMYHLGDIVYDFGEAKYYFDQFYSPYRNYPAPIIAIPGNHDSFIVPGTPAGETPLEVFMRNFCAEQPVVTAEAKSLHRTAMTQPGVYFTLDAPFIRFIGLFSNALEDPGVISSEQGRWAAVPDFQLDYLKAQLTRVKTENYQGAVVITTHHPCFSYTSAAGGSGGGHGSSLAVLAQIDEICQSVGVYPHAFLSGHAHNMQRYTRTVTFNGASLQVPFIVAGASGHHVNALVSARRGQKSAEPAKGSDVTYMDQAPVLPGAKLVLENYEDTDYGYLRATVTAQTLRFDYYTATLTASGAPYDSVTIDLAARTAS